MTTYNVKNQWGGPNAPWHDGGTWYMGGISGQFITYLEMNSDDGGLTMKGEIAFNGGVWLSCRAEEVNTNRYRVEACYNKEKGTWKNLGTWAMGSRYPQKLTNIKAGSEKDNNLTGTITYHKEGPIGFSATLV